MKFSQVFGVSVAHRSKHKKKRGPGSQSPGSAFHLVMSKGYLRTSASRQVLYGPLIVIVIGNKAGAMRRAIRVESLCHWRGAKGGEEGRGVMRQSVVHDL